ncbi:N-acetylmuramoyl-L-alanine amidase [Flagellimonas onchidii]|uniref:N-acetylmuramoyl-L-alanine amidase n=1 Tax=Flagellimonas onchidii TaxID=2562684 RepID=UPI0010A66307|nr:N-acetylmuramoyl-L-alanine amidase [Allomuricauda onchidii]
MKVAIVIGHTKLRQGAYSPHLNITEWEFNKIIAERLEDVATVFCYDSYNGGYTSMIKRMARRINRQKFDLVLELHFNAAESKQANGCEALYYFNNPYAKLLGEDFCELMEIAFNIKNRGAKALYGKHQRGFAAVYYPKPTTLILEPFFGSNSEDCKKLNQHGDWNKYVTVIKDLIRKYRNEFTDY